ncbi:MAG TPA: hypothetical protein VLG27_00485 [Candidatus Saccharimonadia bacterium]|nr:hypothetical protein [Candidatus Saccharimonadia bacterium]
MPRGNYENIGPACENFREVHPRDAFTWKKGLPPIVVGAYAVVFQAVVNQVAEPEHLEFTNQLDFNSREEAELLRKFRLIKPLGIYVPDGELSADQLVRVSTCYWLWQAAAKQAMHKKAHQEAMRYVISGEGKDVYEAFRVLGFRVNRFFDLLSFKLVYDKTFGDAAALAAHGLWTPTEPEMAKLALAA